MNSSSNKLRLRYRTLIVVAGGIAVIIAILAYGFLLSKEMRGMEERWHAFNQNTTERHELLNALNRQLGYGGFSHHITALFCPRMLRSYRWRRTV